MPLPRRDLKLAGVLAVAATISIGLPDAPTETAAQISPTNTLTHNGKTYPPQSLAMPVNDLPGPYERVHPWGEIPYDGANYDARASFIGAAEGPDGNIYVLNRRNRNSCEGRKEPPILKLSPEGKLLASWGVGLFVFPHGLTIDRQGNIWTTDEGNHVVRKFTPMGQLLMTIGQVGQMGNPPKLLTSPPAVIVAPNGNIFVTGGHSAA